MDSEVSVMVYLSTPVQAMRGSNGGTRGSVCEVCQAWMVVAHIDVQCTLTLFN